MFPDARSHALVAYVGGAKMQACTPQLGNFSITPQTWGFTLEISYYSNNTITIFCKGPLDLQGMHSWVIRSIISKVAVDLFQLNSIVFNYFTLCLVTRVTLILSLFKRK